MLFALPRIAFLASYLAALCAVIYLPKSLAFVVKMLRTLRSQLSASVCNKLKTDHLPFFTNSIVRNAAFV